MKENQIDIINIQYILEGNNVSEKILYDKYKIIVSKFLRKNYYKNFDDDDVSEIMIKIFSNLNKYDENKSKFSTWVYHIVKNYMTDKWRCNGTIMLDESESMIVSNTFHNNTFTNYDTTNNNFIFDDSTKFENTNSINYITSQISPDDHLLLDMKYVQGYSYSEIGKEFNLTSSTVSNRVNYIKDKIKKNNKSLIN